MLYNRQAAQDNVRNRDGRRVFYLGKGDQLTSDAKDYLNRERIEVLPASAAKPERYCLLGGGYAEEKPEHMTHLNAQVLVAKTHPRIRFRGKMDLLEAELLLCQATAAEPVRGQLEEVLALARSIIRCDVLETPLEQTGMWGLSWEELRRRSHFPQEYYGQPHFMPRAEDSPLILRINLARTMARQAELAGTQAFCDQDGAPVRPDILQALNRISSVLYLLMIQEKAKA